MVHNNVSFGRAGRSRNFLTPNSVSDKHDAGDGNSENSETLTFNSVNTENLTFNSVNIENLTFNSIDTVCDVNNEGRFVGKFLSPNVINLSGRVLSEAEISLLSKGLKLCPTPNGVNKAVLKDFCKEELEVFGRRLRLMWHFRDEEENNTTINPFRPKSKFNPKGKDVSIELYLSRLEEEILALDTKLSYSNITKGEREALNSLRNDTSIIIKGADKGSAVVVWDREDYLKEANSQLMDNNVYEEVSGDIIGPLVKIVKYHLANIKLRGDISSETLKYFLVNNPKLGRFYLLPKIHKRLDGVPGRPVISNCGYFTENISSFLDYHLQPLAKKVKSYLKDTNDFLRKLRDLPALPKDTLLCTIDVVGLYPNIPHSDGLDAIRKALDQRIDKNISTESLLDLAECVIKNNIFEHNNRFFKQKQGTAIGTKMAPPYAILFMADLEEKFLESSPLKPYVWWRYIDDIFLIWEHGKENLLKFLDSLNNCHPTIKFKAECISQDRVNFLDVDIIRCGERLTTDLYVKPTDSHQYLHASSCHVFHSKSSIPYSQALRLNRICSEGTFFDKRCNELESWLMSRGYSEKLVRRQILRARKLKRDDLLDRAPIKKDSKLVLNVTYHPAHSKVKNVLSDIHLLLTPNEEHRRVFHNVPIVGFKRCKSLKDILVRARLPTENKGPGESCTCGGERCGVCSFVKRSQTFTDKSGLTSYEIRGDKLHCNSKNVVYMVQCKTCLKQYVGSTCTKFRMRFNNYKSCFRKHSSGEAVPQMLFHNHFSQLDHNGMNDWSFTLIDQASNVEHLRKKESFWQYKLDTFHPKGLNERNVTFDFY